MLAIGALPLPGAVALAIDEVAGVAATVGIVEATFALQQAFDHRAVVARAAGQDGIGWKQLGALAAGRKGEGQGQRREAKHAGRPCQISGASSMPQSIRCALLH